MSNNKEDSNQFTKIPNIVFDYWMYLLSDGQFKVFMCICRKIYGWRKTSDKISVRQMMKMTGLSNRAIIKIINDLSSIALILTIKSKESCGDHACTEFLINEKVMNIGGDLKSPQVVTQSHQGGDPKSPGGGDPKSPTKERLHKRKSTKETSSTRKEASDDDDVHKSINFEKEAASSMQLYLEKRVDLWGDGWKIPLAAIEALVLKYSSVFVNAQVNFMIQKQTEASKDRGTSKKVKTTRIEKPESYLRMACSKDYAHYIKENS